jgi:hypothetical protein
MFFKKPRMAIQSVLRTAVDEANTHPLPTDLSILRDESSGRLLVDPTEVIAQVQKRETQALSLDPTLLPGAPFPWLLRVAPNHKHSAPMISGRITPAVMQEAIRRTPNHKAASPVPYLYNTVLEATIFISVVLSICLNHITRLNAF